MIKSEIKRKEYIERKELENEELDAMDPPQLRGKKDKKKKIKPARKPIEALPTFSVGSVSFGDPLRAPRAS